MDEAGYVRYLHSIQNFATAEPARYVQWAMQNLGVTPQSLGLAPIGQQPQSQPQQQQGTGDPRLDELLMDPAVKQLKEEFGRQSTELQKMQAHLQSEAQARREYSVQQERADQAKLMALWNNFRGSIDDHGQLSHPHADTLMQQMGAIMQTDPDIARMQAGPEQLKAAYDAALWARPALRSSLLEAKEAAAKAAADKAAEAERAKRAASVKRATGAPAQKTKKSGLDGALEASMMTHGMG